MKKFNLKKWNIIEKTGFALKLLFGNPINWIIIIISIILFALFRVPLETDKTTMWILGTLLTNLLGGQSIL